jgi:hypothetical protein
MAATEQLAPCRATIRLALRRIFLVSGAPFSAEFDISDISQSRRDAMLIAIELDGKPGGYLRED